MTLIHEHSSYKTSKASLWEGQHRRGQARLAWMEAGPGLPGGRGHHPLVGLHHGGSKKSASLSRGDLPTPPEVGAGTLGVSTCVPKP